MSTARRFLVATALGLALGQPDARAHSAIEPVPRGGDLPQQRYTLLNERVAEVGSTARLLFIGDSITERWDDIGRKVWDHYYGHRDALNLGIAGDRTQHVLWRLDHGQLGDVNPQVAVVLLGTNNVGPGDIDRNSAVQTAEGVRTVVHKLREKLPETKILLLGMLPRGENPDSKARCSILQANQILSRLDDDRNIYFRDFGDQFLADDGTIPRGLMLEYLHLTAKGYALLAKSMEGVLSRLLGDRPVETEPAVEETPDELRWTFPSDD